jgi:hypothetical protein
MRGCRRGEPVDHGQDRTGRDRLRTSDAELSRRRIGKKLDVLNALPEFIEDGDAAPDDGTAVLRRLDSPRAALKKKHAERAFQVGDGARDGRLGRAEALRGLRHAAGFDHGHEHSHIV